MEYEIANVIAISVMILVNVFSMFDFINNTKIKDVSDSKDTKITPSPFTFCGIMIVIFGFLLTFAIYPFVHVNVYVRQLSVFVVLLSFFNIAWVSFFLHERFLLSFVAIVLQIILVFDIYYIYDIRYTLDRTLEMMFVYYAPFSIYFAWIIYVTVSNASILILYEENENNTEKENNAVMIFSLFFSILSSLMLVIRNDYAFALVCFWVLLGLYIKHIKSDRDSYEERDDVKTSILISGGILLAAFGVSLCLLLTFTII